MSQQPPMRNKGGSARTKMGSKKVAAFKKGGRLEGSKADMAEDKKMAKKRNMSLKDWEKSPEDAAMDAKEAGQETYRKGGMKKAARAQMGRYAAGGAAKIRKGVMTKDGAPIKTKARVNG